MELKRSHNWDLTEIEAIKLQEQLVKEVIKTDEINNSIKTVAGIDIAYDKDSDRLIAAVVVLDVTTFEKIETSVQTDTVSFPYIPGLLSFREIPPVIKALEKLTIKPDLLVCDGQGLAHPRRCGIACHLGILFDIPSIGCGKTRLTGEYEEVSTERGSYSLLKEGEEIIGCVLRTQTGINPVFVSVGHKVSLETAKEWILKLSPNYRLPETTRMSDQEANATLKRMKE
ncbi:MAG: deoxyribonuclease V [Bacteroidales bacterium]|nr:deoxyribonuclease V [Bacteroidales bacterium]